MKAGTTTLFEMLSEHPKICSSKNKEPGFFCNTLRDNSCETEYSNLFDYSDCAHEYCLDASTCYTKYPDEIDVPKRMYEYGIRPKIIFSVRNPLRRIESQFNFEKNKDWGPDYLLDARLLHYSMYFLQMHQYFKYFDDMDDYFIVDFQDLIDRQNTVSKRIFDWLGLDNIDTEYVNKNKTKPISIFESTAQKFPFEMSKILPKSISKIAKNVLRTYTPQVKSSLSEDQSQKVKKWIRRDIERFGSTFGFPIGNWGF